MNRERLKEANKLASMIDGCEDICKALNREQISEISWEPDEEALKLLMGYYSKKLEELKKRLEDL